MIFWWYIQRQFLCFILVDVFKDFTLKEARGQMSVRPEGQPEWQSNFHASDFKGGNYLKGRLHRHPYSTRYDMTFLTPSPGQFRCKVGMKSHMWLSDFCATMSLLVLGLALRSRKMEGKSKSENTRRTKWNTLCQLLTFLSVSVIGFPVQLVLFVFHLELFFVIVGFSAFSLSLPSLNLREKPRRVILSFAFVLFHQVWIKNKDCEGSQHEIPYGDVKNVLQEFTFKDKKTNDRCKGWICYPSVKRLRADIAFPGCDLDCRLTIRRSKSELDSDYRQCLRGR